jgi:hypothetical protein
LANIANLWDSMFSDPAIEETTISRRCELAAGAAGSDRELSIPTPQIPSSSWNDQPSFRNLAALPLRPKSMESHSRPSFESLKASS